MTYPTGQRSWHTTVLGVLAIVFAVPTTVISAIALLFAIGKPYANASTSVADIFLMFILPPATLVAGVGLLARWRWARGLMILLMVVLMAVGVKGLFAPHDGNIVIASVFAGLGGLVLLGLFSRPVQREFLKPQKDAEGWRVGHQGRDQMYYEEAADGTWRRIEIDGEMLTGPAHHVIYFANEETWLRYPEWARYRRDEIIARVKSRFREPDYEYVGGGTIPMFRTAAVAPPPKLSNTDGTIVPMVLFLMIIAIASLWYAWSGYERGETRVPVKRGASQGTVIRIDEPALFWASVGLSGCLGGGCLVLSSYLVVWRLRHRRDS